MIGRAMQTAQPPEPTPTQRRALAAARLTRGETACLLAFAWVFTPLIVVVSWHDMPGLGFGFAVAMGALILVTSLVVLALARRRASGRGRPETVASLQAARANDSIQRWFAPGWSVTALMGLIPRLFGDKLPLAYANLLLATALLISAAVGRRRYRRYDAALAAGRPGVPAGPEAPAAHGVPAEPDVPAKPDGPPDARPAPPA